jgi:hypothetical protein
MAQNFGPMPAMKLQAIGYGAGTYDLPGQANVLRIVIGETELSTDGSWKDAIPLEHDRVVVIETNIDDSTAEDLADCSTQACLSGSARCLSDAVRDEERTQRRPVDRRLFTQPRCMPSRTSAVHRYFHHRRPPLHRRARQVDSRVDHA